MSIFFIVYSGFRRQILIFLEFVLGVPPNFDTRLSRGGWGQKPRIVKKKGVTPNKNVIIQGEPLTQTQKNENLSAEARIVSIEKIDILVPQWHKGKLPYVIDRVRVRFFKNFHIFKIWGGGFLPKTGGGDFHPSSKEKQYSRITLYPEEQFF